MHDLHASHLNPQEVIFSFTMKHQPDLEPNGLAILVPFNSKDWSSRSDFLSLSYWDLATWDWFVDTHILK